MANAVNCPYLIGCHELAAGPYRYRLFHAYVGGSADPIQSIDGTLDTVSRQPLPIGWLADSPSRSMRRPRAA